jgi:glutamate racemase
MKTYGLFDSGIGGLSVLRAMLAEQPDLSAVYIADTAWVPYGTKPPQQLKARVTTIAQWLLPQVRQLVVACNTSAALMQDQWPTSVIDPITATAQAFALQPGIKHVGVLATPNTVASQAYIRALQKKHPGLQVSQCACPGLADAIENGSVASLAGSLTQWVSSLCHPEPPEVIVLGCTHYPFAHQTITQAILQMGADIPLFDPANTIARLATQTEVSMAEQPRLQLFTTGDAAHLQAQLQQLALPASIKQLTPETIHF